MKIFYRVSDNSYSKQKLPGADKEACLTNFMKVFQDIVFNDSVMKGEIEPPVYLIADRCTPATNKMLTKTGLPLRVTDLGNAGSLHFALDLASEVCRDGELAYFVEDDYLHLGNAPQLLREGMVISDYITLYDHPDKYTNIYDMGETSKVVRTNSSHWRYTISTCMTFAVKSDILKEDIDTFKEHVGTVDSKAEHPLDHDIFTALNEKGRKLAVCIPGAACHTDLSFSVVANRLMIEPWAIETMMLILEDRLAEIKKRVQPQDMDRFNELEKSVLKNKKGYDRLLVIDALLKKCE